MIIKSDTNRNAVALKYVCKHFDRSGSNQENSEKHHLFSDISPDSEKIPKIKKIKQTTKHKRFVQSKKLSQN